MEYALEDLERRATIYQGHFADLKLDGETERVWLSRMTIEDGEPYNNKVTVERLENGRWVEAREYEAA